MTPPPEGTPASPQPLPLGLLSRRLRDARARLHVQRHGPVASAELNGARRDLVRALTDYTTALEERRLPVPYALRLELQLHGRLSDWSA